MPSSVLRVVVSDAGPLVALGRLGLLHLLPALFVQVQGKVPNAVRTECMARPQNADAARIKFAVAQGRVQAGHDGGTASVGNV